MNPVREKILDLWFADVAESLLPPDTVRLINRLTRIFEQHVRDPKTGRYDVSEIDTRRARMLAKTLADDPVCLAERWFEFGG